MFTITNTAIHHLRCPSDRMIKTSWGVMKERHAIFIALTNDLGHNGYGESWINFPTWSPYERLAAFNHAYFPYLQNKTVTDVKTFMTAMTRAFLGPAIQANNLGSLIAELCAIELALYDLEAKTKNLPLSKLWFQNPATQIEIYASGINSPLPWQDIDDMLAAGVRLFKLKVGFGDEDLPNIKALHKHLAPHHARFAIDTNRAWSVDEALRWLPILRDHNVLWLEEPLKPSEEIHYPRLADPYVIGLSAGENIWQKAGDPVDAFVDFPVHILQPDITKNCSPSAALDIIALARQKQKPVFPHFLGSAIGQAASLHLAAGCIAFQFSLCEWDINPNPLRTNLLGPDFKIQDGKIKIPDRPGLGWTPEFPAEFAL